MREFKVWVPDRGETEGAARVVEASTASHAAEVFAEDEGFRMEFAVMVADGLGNLARVQVSSEMVVVYRSTATFLRQAGMPECMVQEGGLVVDDDPERVMAWLRACPTKDGIGSRCYPAVRADVAQALADRGLVRLVDWQIAGEHGAWLVEVLDDRR